MRMLRDKALPLGIFAGAMLRVLAACCSYGWFTRDDYQLGIEQAYLWLHQADAAFPAEIRSPVLSRGCTALMHLGESIGVRDRAHLVRWLYGCLGMFSLLAVPPVHALAKRTFNASVAAVAVWLMAAYAIMPAISVRAMIEVVAIVPLAWGCDWLDRARRERRFATAFAAALALALATLLRFQLGLLFIAACWVLRRQGRRALGGLCCGALVGVALQALCDIGIGRAPLATPWAYVRFNLENAASYGTSPWYTYLLHFVLLTVPPATFALGKPLWRALRRQPVVAAMLTVFIAVHSAVGHKEDRFMFSMLPLFFVVLAAALHEAWHGARWQRASVAWFAGVNFVVLLFATVSDTHRSVNAPLVWLGRHDPTARIASVGFWTLPTYYLGDAAELQMFGGLDELARARADGAAWDYVWLRGPALDAQIAEVSALTEQRCRRATFFSGDFADRVLVRVNRHNARRGPTALMRCDG